MNKFLQLLLFALILEAIALILMFLYGGWQLTLAIFLWSWAHNIEDH